MMNAGLESLLACRGIRPASPTALLVWLEEQIQLRPRLMEVQFCLAAGTVMKGHFVRYSPGQGGLLLRQADALTWIETSALTAVTLVDAREWHRWLCEEEPRPTEKIPSRLELKRFAHEIGTRLQPTQLRLAWDDVPGDERSALYLQEFLNTLAASWAELASDSLGLAAIAQIEQVVLEVGSQARPPTLVGGQCTITLCRGPEGLVALPQEPLVRQLEKLL